jgi:predicted DNA-binding transcriptional regulator AlpA
MTENDFPVREPLYVPALQCAQRYGFSKRHWMRLVNSGRAPQQVRFGRLTRWSVQTLQDWESAGCPSGSDDPADLRDRLSND